jgi:hypothetical protein
MKPIAHIAVLAGDTPASRAVAGAATSLLTAVGRWVDEVPADGDLQAYDAIVLPRAHDWHAARARFAGPLLIVDADLLDGAAPAFPALAVGRASTAVSVDGVSMLLPRPLPTLAGRALGPGMTGTAMLAAPGVGYVLPVVVTPALRTVPGFWALATLLEEALAELLGEPRPLYVDPWPDGRRSARALTVDLDGITSREALAPLFDHGRPATLFACADMLPRLGTPGQRCELAAHGDVHRSFADDATNLARVDRMLAAFHSAGLTPAGFSPPNMAYSSPLAPLFARFRYLRLGYQERALRFFPTDTAGGTVAAVSYYTDFMLRYVGAEEFARLLGRFCAWASATGVLAVPCLHPCLWAEPLERYLALPADGAWEATLAQISAWRVRRRESLGTVAAHGEAAAPADVRLERTTPAARLAALRSHGEVAAHDDAAREARRVAVGGRGYRVVPAAPRPAAAVDVALGGAWRALAWLPRGVAAAAARTFCEVTNKNGLHACFYGELGLAPQVAGGAVRLPLVAADEPVFLARRPPGRLGRLARRLVRRATPEVEPVA